MAELIDKSKAKELPVYEFGVSLLSAERYVKLSDLESLPTTTEAEIREQAIADFVEHITLPLTTEEDIARILEQLKGE